MKVPEVFPRLGISLLRGPAGREEDQRGPTRTLLRTNVDGCQTIVIEDVVSEWCQKPKLQDIP